MAHAARISAWMLLFALALPVAAKPQFVTIDHRVASVSAHDGSAIKLLVREKRATAKPAKAVLLVHGATISGVPDFDPGARA